MVKLLLPKVNITRNISNKKNKTCFNFPFPLEILSYENLQSCGMKWIFFFFTLSRGFQPEGNTYQCNEFSHTRMIFLKHQTPSITTQKLKFVLYSSVEKLKKRMIFIETCFNFPFPLEIFSYENLQSCGMKWIFFFLL